MTGNDILKILKSFTDSELDLELKIFDHKRGEYDSIEDVIITHPHNMDETIIQLYRK